MVIFHSYVAVYQRVITSMNWAKFLGWSDLESKLSPQINTPTSHLKTTGGVSLWWVIRIYTKAASIIPYDKRHIWLNYKEIIMNSGRVGMIPVANIDRGLGRLVHHLAERASAGGVRGRWWETLEKNSDFKPKP